MAKSSNTGEPKTSKTGEPKARRAPVRRRTDKAVPAAAGHAAEMAAVTAPADLAPVAAGHQALQTMTSTDIGQPLTSNGPSLAQIERRAYEIYLARGGTNGRDLEDWLEAERQLRNN